MEPYPMGLWTGNICGQNGDSLDIKEHHQGHVCAHIMIWLHLVVKELAVSIFRLEASS
jgi:hypothetical protein